MKAPGLAGPMPAPKFSVCVVNQPGPAGTCNTLHTLRCVELVRQFGEFLSRILLDLSYTDFKLLKFALFLVVFAEHFENLCVFAVKIFIGLIDLCVFAGKLLASIIN